MTRGTPEAQGSSEPAAPVLAREPAARTDPPAPAGVDVTRPSPARLYDCFLGGTHNFQVDRAAAERIRAVAPEADDVAWANRAFHQRAARWLAVQRGVEQFIDLGSGLPTAGTTHDAVRQPGTDARVVYVDLDPMVALLSAELLRVARGTAIVTADIRDPAAVLGHPDLRALIDFSRPVGLLATAVLHFVAPASDPWGLVRRYLRECAPGSYLVLSHGTADRIPPDAAQMVRDVYGEATERIFLRSREQVERFFDGLELVAPYHGAPPSVCHVGEWGAEDVGTADSDGSRALYCGVARLP